MYKSDLRFPWDLALAAMKKLNKKLQVRKYRGADKFHKMEAVKFQTICSEWGNAMREHLPWALFDDDDQKPLAPSTPVGATTSRAGSASSASCLPPSSQTGPLQMTSPLKLATLAHIPTWLHRDAQQFSASPQASGVATKMNGPANTRSEGSAAMTGVEGDEVEDTEAIAGKDLPAKPEATAMVPEPEETQVLPSTDCAITEVKVMPTKRLKTTASPVCCQVDMGPMGPARGQWDQHGPMVFHIALSTIPPCRLPFHTDYTTRHYCNDQLAL